jgi:hypothetical protein
VKADGELEVSTDADQPVYLVPVRDQEVHWELKDAQSDFPKWKEKGLSGAALHPLGVHIET